MSKKGGGSNNLWELLLRRASSSSGHETGGGRSGLGQEPTRASSANLSNISQSSRRSSVFSEGADGSDKDSGKKKKNEVNLERRESSRLQNAAKLLRNLSRSKDVSAQASHAAENSSHPPPSDQPESPARSAASEPTKVDRWRHQPAYQSEGKGVKKRNRAANQQEDGGGKHVGAGGQNSSRKVDRAHSFCGKMDKKEKRLAVLERRTEKSKSCQRLEKYQAEEGVVAGAKSILLTEDNLAPVHSPRDAGAGHPEAGHLHAEQVAVQSPDLIQDLPYINNASSINLSVDRIRKTSLQQEHQRIDARLTCSTPISGLDPILMESEPTPQNGDNRQYHPTEGRSSAAGYSARGAKSDPKAGNMERSLAPQSPNVASPQKPKSTPAASHLSSAGHDEVADRFADITLSFSESTGDKMAAPQTAVGKMTAPQSAVDNIGVSQPGKVLDRQLSDNNKPAPQSPGKRLQTPSVEAFMPSALGHSRSGGVQPYEPFEKNAESQDHVDPHAPKKGISDDSREQRCAGDPGDQPLYANSQPVSLPPHISQPQHPSFLQLAEGQENNSLNHLTKGRLPLSSQFIKQGLSSESSFNQLTYRNHRAQDGGHPVQFADGSFSQHQLQGDSVQRQYGAGGIGSEAPASPWKSGATTHHVGLNGNSKHSFHPGSDLAASHEPEPNSNWRKQDVLTNGRPQPDHLPSANGVTGPDFGLSNGRAGAGGHWSPSKNEKMADSRLSRASSPDDPTYATIDEARHSSLDSLQRWSDNFLGDGSAYVSRLRASSQHLLSPVIDPRNDNSPPALAHSSGAGGSRRASQPAALPFKSLPHMTSPEETYANIPSDLIEQSDVDTNGELEEYARKYEAKHRHALAGRRQASVTAGQHLSQDTTLSLQDGQFSHRDLSQDKMMSGRSAFRKSSKVESHEVEDVREASGAQHPNHSHGTDTSQEVVIAAGPHHPWPSTMTVSQGSARLTNADEPTAQPSERPGGAQSRVWDQTRHQTAAAQVKARLSESMKTSFEQPVLRRHKNSAPDPSWRRSEYMLNDRSRLNGSVMGQDQPGYLGSLGAVDSTAHNYRSLYNLHLNHKNNNDGMATSLLLASDSALSSEDRRPSFPCGTSNYCVPALDRTETRIEENLHNRFGSVASPVADGEPVQHLHHTSLLASSRSVPNLVESDGMRLSSSGVDDLDQPRHDLSQDINAKDNSHNNIIGGVEPAAATASVTSRSTTPADSHHHAPTSASSPTSSTASSSSSSSSGAATLTNSPASTYSYLDPDKRLRVSDNTLKLIQKQAVLEYYERQRRVDKLVAAGGQSEDSMRQPPERTSVLGSPNGLKSSGFSRSTSQMSLSSARSRSSATSFSGGRSPSQASIASAISLQQGLTSTSVEEEEEEDDLHGSNGLPSAQRPQSVLSNGHPPPRSRSQSRMSGVLARTVVPSEEGGPTPRSTDDLEAADGNAIRQTESERIACHGSSMHGYLQPRDLNVSATSKESYGDNASPRLSIGDHQQVGSTDRPSHPVTKSLFYRHHDQPPSSDQMAAAVNLPLPRDEAAATPPPPSPPPSPGDAVESMDSLPLPPPPPMLESEQNEQPLDETIIASHHAEGDSAESLRTEDLNSMPSKISVQQAKTETEETMSSSSSGYRLLTTSYQPVDNKDRQQHQQRRGSPASLAARTAPGWQRFLGADNNSQLRPSQQPIKKYSLSAAVQQRINDCQTTSAEENDAGQPERSENTNDAVKDRIGFTSEEAVKFRRPKSRWRGAGSRGVGELSAGPTSLPFTPHLGASGLKGAKSSPTLLESPLSMTGGNPTSSSSSSGQSSLSLCSAWWKTSMESMPSSNSNSNVHTNPQIINRNDSNPGLEARDNDRQSGKHSYSNSDSGLSSLSGRTSCMSPLSVVSTVSSASSGSSRASLRSASIVSSSTLPLEEEGGGPDDDEHGGDNRAHHVKEMLKSRLGDDLASLMSDMTAKLDQDQFSSIKMLLGSGVGLRTVGDYLSDLRTYHLEQDIHSQHQYTSSNSSSLARAGSGLAMDSSLNQVRGAIVAANDSFGGQSRGATASTDPRRLLADKLESKLNGYRTKETGVSELLERCEHELKEIISKMTDVGTNYEVEKYRVHVMEIGKVSALLLSLSRRLAKTENSLGNLTTTTASNNNEAESLHKKKEKLQEQLEEAKLLKTSIEKRTDVLAGIIDKKLSSQLAAAYKKATRHKVELLLEQGCLQDLLAHTQQQINIVKTM